MADIKVQFRTSAEDRDWFKATAEAAGVTQDELFAQMKDSFSAGEFADAHPDHRASLEVLDAHLAAIRSQLMGQIEAYDQARESARLKLQDQIDRAERDRFEALTARDAAKAETEEARSLVADLKTQRDAALERAGRAEEYLKQIEEMRQAAERSAEEIARVRAALDRTRDDLDKKREETSALRSRYEKEIGEANERVKMADAKARDAEVEVSGLKATVSGLRSEVELLKAQIERLNASASTAEALTQSLLSQITSRDNRIAALESTLDHVKDAN